MMATREAITRGLLRLGLAAEVPAPRGGYAPALTGAGLIFTAGQLSRLDGGLISGALHGDHDISRGRQAAEICAGRCLAAAASALPDGAGITGVLQMRGFVNSLPGFTAHSRVLDAASVVLEAVLAEPCRFVRTAVGVPSPPDNGTCEVECIFTFAIAP
ncbi:RidA family protein [Pseudooceanicola sp. GBMRC 2024]|uniref:RidA family protein n=1 Tax=Pseudooceanicola albus TaxID=2692189 RepID=A0A6L7G1W4_9RHOB|nr:RidA family protein [Pseudooceanicola albus]MXN17722.1 RidA family protein [Pseudooceanicola albus]